MSHGVRTRTSLRDEGDDAHARPGSRSGRNRGCLAPSRGPERLAEGADVYHWLYREGEFRGYSDIDLLVQGSDVGAAEKVLEGLGFERIGLQAIEGDWPRYARNWVRRSDLMNVDLHQTLAGVGVPPTDLWAALTERREQMNVAGVNMDVLAPPARALVLACTRPRTGRVSPKPVMTWVTPSIDSNLTCGSRRCGLLTR
jgi:hypothetical protein